MLLPRSLEIPAESLAEGVQPREYVLCAVQNHLGTSAHGGHYVAEVMDWATGVWNEFNDEDVTVLEKGPTSSFDPTEREVTAANAKAKKKSKVQAVRTPTIYSTWTRGIYRSNARENCSVSRTNRGIPATSLRTWRPSAMENTASNESKCWLSFAATL